MNSDIDRWNARYRQHDGRELPQACELLREYRHLLPGQGVALDIACGRGGNALLLANNGLTTYAWDYADVAIQELQQLTLRLNLSIATMVRDVLKQPPSPASFDVIVTSYYLERDLVQPLVDALKPGGLLFYQTFTRDRVSETGPGNPDYRLASNELLQLFSKLQIVVYREEGTIGNTNQGFRDRAQLVGHKPA